MAWHGVVGGYEVQYETIEVLPSKNVVVWSHSGKVILPMI